MLPARAQPPLLPPLLSKANSPSHTVRAFRPRRLASSRAAAASAATASESASLRLRGGHKHKQVASVANPLVKHCVKLRHSAAYRRSCRRLLVVGLPPILEVCRFGFSTVDCLLLLDGVEVPEELHELSGDVVHVSATVMKKISGMQSVDSTEAIAVMHMPKYFCDLESDEGGAGLDGLFHSPKRILVLDGIQDPGNLGTLIRSACAFKWDGIFLLPACCDPFNEKALRAARGASLQLPIVSGNWCDLHALVTKYGMKMLAGHPESSSDGSERTRALSKELADSLVSESICLALGSEGNGLSAETTHACELVHIPMEERKLQEFVELGFRVMGSVLGSVEYWKWTVANDSEISKIPSNIKARYGVALAALQPVSALIVGVSKEGIAFQAVSYVLEALTRNFWNQLKTWTKMPSKLYEQHAQFIHDILKFR